MRSMHAADERAHVGGGARSGDNDDVAFQSIAIEAGGVEKIARAADDALARQEHDTKGHQEAGGTDQRAAQRNANGTGAGNSGEGFGDADGGSGKLFVIRLQDDAGESVRAGENVRREKLGVAYDEALQTF